MTSPQPHAARSLLDAGIDNGWSVAWLPGESLNEHPYITVRLVKEGIEHRATWHTRDTGTYRLTKPMTRVGGRWIDTTLTAIKKDVAR